MANPHETLRIDRAKLGDTLCDRLEDVASRHNHPVVVVVGKRRDALLSQAFDTIFVDPLAFEPTHADRRERVHPRAVLIGLQAIMVVIALVFPDMGSRLNPAAIAWFAENCTFVGDVWATAWDMSVPAWADKTDQGKLMQFVLCRDLSDPDRPFYTHVTLVTGSYSDRVPWYIEQPSTNHSAIGPYSASTAAVSGRMALWQIKRVAYAPETHLSSSLPIATYIGLIEFPLKALQHVKASVSLVTSTALTPASFANSRAAFEQNNMLPIEAAVIEHQKHLQNYPNTTDVTTFREEAYYLHPAVWTVLVFLLLNAHAVLIEFDILLNAAYIAFNVYLCINKPHLWFSIAALIILTVYNLTFGTWLGLLMTIASYYIHMPVYLPLLVDRVADEDYVGRYIIGPIKNAMVWYDKMGERHETPADEAVTHPSGEQCTARKFVPAGPTSLWERIWFFGAVTREQVRRKSVAKRQAAATFSSLLVVAIVLSSVIGAAQAHAVQVRPETNNDATMGLPRYDGPHRKAFDIALLPTDVPVTNVMIDAGIKTDLIRCHACPPGTYQAIRCSALSDTVCVPYTTCSAEQFEIAAPTPSSDRRCHVDRFGIRPQRKAMWGACSPDFCNVTAAPGHYLHHNCTTGRIHVEPLVVEPIPSATSLTHDAQHFILDVIDQLRHSDMGWCTQCNNQTFCDAVVGNQSVTMDFQSTSNFQRYQVSVLNSSVIGLSPLRLCNYLTKANLTRHIVVPCELREDEIITEGMCNMEGKVMLFNCTGAQVHLPTCNTWSVKVPAPFHQVATIILDLVDQLVQGGWAMAYAVNKLIERFPNIPVMQIVMDAPSYIAQGSVYTMDSVTKSISLANDMGRLTLADLAASKKSAEEFLAQFASTTVASASTATQRVKETSAWMLDSVEHYRQAVRDAYGEAKNRGGVFAFQDYDSGEAPPAPPKPSEHWATEQQLNSKGTGRATVPRFFGALALSHNLHDFLVLHDMQPPGLFVVLALLVETGTFCVMVSNTVQRRIPLSLTLLGVVLLAAGRFQLSIVLAAVAIVFRNRAFVALALATAITIGFPIALLCVSVAAAYESIMTRARVVFTNATNHVQSMMDRAVVRTNVCGVATLETMNAELEGLLKAPEPSYHSSVDVVLREVPEPPTKLQSSFDLNGAGVVPNSSETNIVASINDRARSNKGALNEEVGRAYATFARKYTEDMLYEHLKLPDLSTIFHHWWPTLSGSQQERAARATIPQSEGAAVPEQTNIFIKIERLFIDRDEKTGRIIWNASYSDVSMFAPVTKFVSKIVKCRFGLGFVWTSGYTQGQVGKTLMEGPAGPPTVANVKAGNTTAATLGDDIAIKDKSNVPSDVFRHGAKDVALYALGRVLTASVVPVTMLDFCSSSIVKVFDPYGSPAWLLVEAPLKTLLKIGNHGKLSASGFLADIITNTKAYEEKFKWLPPLSEFYGLWHEKLVQRFPKAKPSATDTFLLQKQLKHQDHKHALTKHIPSPDDTREYILNHYGVDYDELCLDIAAFRPYIEQLCEASMVTAAGYTTRDEGLAVNFKFNLHAMGPALRKVATMDMGLTLDGKKLTTQKPGVTAAFIKHLASYNNDQHGTPSFDARLGGTQVLDFPMNDYHWSGDFKNKHVLVNMVKLLPRATNVLLVGGSPMRWGRRITRMFPQHRFYIIDPRAPTNNAIPWIDASVVLDSPNPTLDNIFKFTHPVGGNTHWTVPGGDVAVYYDAPTKLTVRDEEVDEVTLLLHLCRVSKRIVRHCVKLNQNRNVACPVTYSITAHDQPHFANNHVVVSPPWKKPGSTELYYVSPTSGGAGCDPYFENDVNGVPRPNAIREHTERVGLHRPNGGKKQPRGWKTHLEAGVMVCIAGPHMLKSINYKAKAEDIAQDVINQDYAVPDWLPRVRFMHHLNLQCMQAVWHYRLNNYPRRVHDRLRTCGAADIPNVAISTALLLTIAGTEEDINEVCNAGAATYRSSGWPKANDLLRSANNFKTSLREYWYCGDCSAYDMTQNVYTNARRYWVRLVRCITGLFTNPNDMFKRDQIPYRFLTTNLAHDAAKLNKITVRTQSMEIVAKEKMASGAPDTSMSNSMGNLMENMFAEEVMQASGQIVFQNAGAPAVPAPNDAQLPPHKDELEALEDAQMFELYYDEVPIKSMAGAGWIIKRKLVKAKTSAAERAVASEFFTNTNEEDGDVEEHAVSKKPNRATHSRDNVVTVVDNPNKMATVPVSKRIAPRGPKPAPPPRAGKLVARARLPASRPKHADSDSNWTTDSSDNGSDSSDDDSHVDHTQPRPAPPVPANVAQAATGQRTYANKAAAPAKQDRKQETNAQRAEELRLDAERKANAAIRASQVAVPAQPPQRAQPLPDDHVPAALFEPTDKYVNVAGKSTKDVLRDLPSVQHGLIKQSKQHSNDAKKAKHYDRKKVDKMAPEKQTPGSRKGLAPLDVIGSITTNFQPTSETVPDKTFLLYVAFIAAGVLALLATVDPFAPQLASQETIEYLYCPAGRTNCAPVPVFMPWLRYLYQSIAQSLTYEKLPVMLKVPSLFRFMLASISFSVACSLITQSPLHTTFLNSVIFAPVVEELYKRDTNQCIMLAAGEFMSGLATGRGWKSLDRCFHLVSLFVPYHVAVFLHMAWNIYCCWAHVDAAGCFLARISTVNVRGFVRVFSVYTDKVVIRCFGKKRTRVHTIRFNPCEADCTDQPYINQEFLEVEGQPDLTTPDQSAANLDIPEVIAELADEEPIE